MSEAYEFLRISILTVVGLFFGHKMGVDFREWRERKRRPKKDDLIKIEG